MNALIIFSKSCSTGTFSLRDGKQHIALDVVPMQPGLLYYPLVTIYRYVDQLHGKELTLRKFVIWLSKNC